MTTNTTQKTTTRTYTLEEIQKIIIDEFFGYGYDVAKTELEGLKEYIPRLQGELREGKYKDEKDRRMLENHIMQEIKYAQRMYKNIQNMKAQAMRKTFRLVMSQKLKEVEAE